MVMSICTCCTSLVVRVIKEAVEKIFGVKVEKVNTINVRGKLKRQGRTQGYTSKRKKAIVQLTKDSKAIEFFENLA